MEKHAYLILAHKNDETFKTLIRLLDDSYNDIYIHMDIKNTNYREDDIKSLVRESDIYFTERTNIHWGGYSSIRAELLLLEMASERMPYKYYHLLSGEDLPVKSQKEIHRFFDENAGKEFVRFESDSMNYEDRVRYYHLFQERLGRRGDRPVREKLNKGFVVLQKILGVKRNKNIWFQKGSCWFSITDKLARYIIERKQFIEKCFKYTYCCDEVFVQTIVDNSSFKDSLYHCEYDNSCESIMRLIDWTRGKPYTFHIEDLDELKNTKMLWARKFSQEVDSDIVVAIEDYLSKGRV